MAFGRTGLEAIAGWYWDFRAAQGWRDEPQLANLTSPHLTGKPHGGISWRLGLPNVSSTTIVKLNTIL